MKVLNIILTLLLLTSGLAASVDPYDIVVVEDETSATILFRSTIPMEHDSELTLVTFNNEVIYQQTISAGTFLNRRIRKEGIPSGSYQLIITDERGSTSIPMTIDRSGMICDITRAKRVFYPNVNLTDKRLLVVNYKNESGKRVNVRLTDAEGHEIFADRLEGESIRRSYQLDQLEAGKYTVTVSSRNVKNYTAAIALD